MRNANLTLQRDCIPAPRLAQGSGLRVRGSFEKRPGFWVEGSGYLPTVLSPQPRANRAPSPEPTGVVGQVLLLCVVLIGPLAPEGRAEEELRDPFAFGPRVEAMSNTVVKPAGPTLMGILWDATRPLAIIGEETVAVGDTVDGWKVLNIQQESVVLQRGDQRKVIAPGDPIPAD